MNQIVPSEQNQRRQVIEVQDPIPLLDTSQFEHMQRVATVMARTSLIPESLWKEKDAELPFERIISNCFLIVNQAVRWGMDPFAVAQCVAVVKGKLCYEGKLVSAVLDAKLGLRLHHHFTGDGEEKRIYLSDRPFDDETIGQLKPGFSKPGWRLFDGSVAEWKTTSSGSPWSPKNFPRMLVYRGTRDWCRIYEPAIMLGVYTPDEMLDLNENARALRARSIDGPTLQERLAAAKVAPQSTEGFARSFVSSEAAALTSGQEIQKQEPSDPTSDVVDVSNGDIDQGSGGVAATAPADTADEAEQPEGGDNPGAVATEQPASPSEAIHPGIYSLMSECIDNMLRDAMSEPASDREAKLAKTYAAFIGELPDHRRFVDLCRETVSRIIGNTAEREKAKAYLLAKVPPVAEVE